MMRNPSLRARLISSPSNFNHLVHVGPSEKQHQLQDLHLAQEEKRREADGRMRCSSLSEMRRPLPEDHNGSALGPAAFQRLKTGSSVSDNSSLTPTSLFSDVSSLGEVSDSSLPSSPRSTNT